MPQPGRVHLSQVGHALPHLCGPVSATAASCRTRFDDLPCWWRRSRRSAARPPAAVAMPAPAPRPTTVETIAAPQGEGTLTLPATRTSVKFAVIGDSGRGTPPQHEVAAQMVRYREAFPFAFVLMLGDNIYEGPATPDDYRTKFEEPYQALLDKGVKFYAVLGNHDDPRQVLIRAIQHGWRAVLQLRAARRRHRPPRDARRVLRHRLDEPRQHATPLAGRAARRIEGAIGRSASSTIRSTRRAAIATSRGCTGGRSSRSSLRHGVKVVFSGHEHIYQRSVLEQGIQVLRQRRRRLAPGWETAPARHTSRATSTPTITSC